MRFGTTKSELIAALMDAFRQPGDMQIVVADLEDVLPFANFLAVQGTTYEAALFNLLESIEAKNKLLPFLSVAQRRNPDNPRMQGIYQQFQISKHKFDSFEPSVSFEEAERLVLKSVTFEDVPRWLSELARVRRAVCRIEPQPQDESVEGYGSGYLVGDDMVLTCFHVVSQFWDNLDRARRVRCRFDYEHQTSLSIGKGTEHALDVSNGPPSAGLAIEIKELDIALLKLAQPAARDLLPGGTRGFLRLEPRAVAAGDPLLIVQHPAAAPMKLAFGAVTQPDLPSHVLYRINTEGGSSGSPCLSQDLKIVATHHQGRTSQNRGIAHLALLSQLEAKRELLNERGLSYLLP